MGLKRVQQVATRGGQDTESTEAPGLLKTRDSSTIAFQGRGSERDGKPKVFLLLRESWASMRKKSKEEYSVGGSWRLRGNGAKLYPTAEPYCAVYGKASD